MEHTASHKCTVGSVLVVLIASLLFGIIIGSTGPSIDTMKNEVMDFEGNIMRLPETSEFVVFTASEASWFSALVAVGALVGAIIGGPIVNGFGHKIAIAVTCPIYIISFLIQAYVSNVWLLFLSRVMTGISVGMNSFTVPTYISEVSPNHLRGLLGACNQLAITTGILVVYFLGANLTIDGGLVLSADDPTKVIGMAPPESFCNWRLLAFLNSVPTCLLIILITVIPESPLWYARNGRISEALIAHRRLRGGYEIEPEAKELMLLDVRHTAEKSDPTLSLFPSAVKPIFICIALAFFQQFSGINAIMFFCTSILRNAKIKAPNTLSVTVMAEQVLITALACYLMDKVGRRILLISSAAVMTAASGLFGLYFFLQAQGASHITPMVFVSVYTYMAAFSLGVGPIPWLLMGEVIPSDSRATGSSIVTAHNWLFAFVVTVGLDSYTGLVGYHGVMWSFAICCLGLTIFATFLVPETRGKSFTEIAEFFGHSYTPLPVDIEKGQEKKYCREMNEQTNDVEIYIDVPGLEDELDTGITIVAEPITEEDTEKMLGIHTTADDEPCPQVEYNSTQDMSWITEKYMKDFTKRMEALLEKLADTHVPVVQLENSSEHDLQARRQLVWLQRGPERSESDQSNTAPPSRVDNETMIQVQNVNASDPAETSINQVQNPDLSARKRVLVNPSPYI